MLNRLIPVLMGKLWRSLACTILFPLIHGVYSASDPLEPNGNITVRWDVLSWTEDGHNAYVTIWNYQQYRHVEYPGWRLGWGWKGKEVIWDMVGAQATEQGDCSGFKANNIPHSCSKHPIIVDLLPDVTSDFRIANCCKGGILSSMVQNPLNSVAAFKMKIGVAGTSKKTVVPPSNFTLEGPQSVYSCSHAIEVDGSHFQDPGGVRQTQAIKTWMVTCKYSPVLAHKVPVCCASFSSFYNEIIIPCPACSCGCHDPSTNISKVCFRRIPSPPPINNNTSARTDTKTVEVQCTRHMCPIRVHWHVKASYRGYWRAKISIINFAVHKNYTDWNLVIQHPNFKKLERVFSFNYTSLAHNRITNDSAMLWGIKYFNDVLLEAGAMGNVQSEILLQKMKGEFSFGNGWVFPHRVYFDGDECILPPPDAYPLLPTTTTPVIILSRFLFIATILSGASFVMYLHRTCTFKRSNYREISLL